MLTVFPGLLFLDPLAPFLLRVTVGIIFLFMGYNHLTRERREGIATDLRLKWGATGTFFIWYLGIFEIVVGLFLIAGFLTQIAAIVGGIIALKLLHGRKKYPKISPQSTSFYILLFVICLSFLVTGAGAFAIDLPL